MLKIRFFQSVVSLGTGMLLVGILACGGGGGGGSNAAALSTPTGPVITTQPASREVVVSAAATFTVAASGTPALIYQWQVSTNGGSTWADVSTGTGATTASYVTAAALQDDDGKQFRVVVSNSVGSVESHSATLYIHTSTITHGRQVNETNTGVPAGHTLTNVASTILVTEDWIANSNSGSRILENRNFLSGASLIVTVDGFTVQYCKFFGNSGFTTFANDGVHPIGNNITILDCEFDGNHQNLGGAVAIGGSFITVKRVHVHRWPRAMWVGDGDVWVEQCYFHDLTCDGGDAHLENIYVGGGANQTYLRNKFISNEIHIHGDTKMMTSASLAIYNEQYDRGAPFPPFPALDSILVQDNYFESDGYYTLYGGACTGKGNPYAKHTVFQGNIFGRGLHRWSGVGGPAVCFDPSQPGNLWMNNTWGPRGPYWQTGDPEEGATVAAPTPN